MLPWLRNIIIIILILTLIYAVLSFKARRQFKEKLTGAYEASDKTESQEVYIAKGLSRYQRSYRPRLILTVYLYQRPIPSYTRYYQRCSHSLLPPPARYCESCRHRS